MIFLFCFVVVVVAVPLVEFLPGKVWSDPSGYM